MILVLRGSFYAVSRTRSLSVLWPAALSHFVFSIVFLKSNVKHFHSFGLVVFSNNDVCVCALRILLSYQICLLQCNVYF